MLRIPCFEPLLTSARGSAESWTCDPAPVDRAALRNTIQADPIVAKWQVTPSSDPKEYYGTRLATVLLIRRDGSVCFVERDVWMLDLHGDVMKADAKNQQRVFHFQLDLDTRSDCP